MTNIFNLEIIITLQILIYSDSLGCVITKTKISTSINGIDLMSSYFQKNEDGDCMDVPHKSIHLKTIVVVENFESDYY